MLFAFALAVIKNERYPFFINLIKTFDGKLLRICLVPFITQYSRHSFMLLTTLVFGALQSIVFGRREVEALSEIFVGQALRQLDRVKISIGTVVQNHSDPPLRAQIFCNDSSVSASGKVCSTS
jgi:hypothetical protein